MFDVEVNEFSSKTDKLLKNIEGLLKEQNELLRQALSMQVNKSDDDGKIKDKPNIDGMGRKELLTLIKTFPKGTIKGKYMTMEIEELRNKVKEVLQCLNK
jgi:hypothetical protein